MLYSPPYHCDMQPIEMVWSQVKSEVGRQYDLSTRIVIVKQRLEAAFERLNADTTGRIENLYAHVRKIFNKNTWRRMTMQDIAIVKTMQHQT